MMGFSELPSHLDFPVTHLKLGHGIDNISVP